MGSVLTPEKSSRTPLDTINARDIPEWVIILAQKCDETSQSAVAEAMGYSAALISTVLKNAYTGDLRRVEARVKDMYIRADVPCPVMGEITGAQCTQYQHRAVTGASSI
nr:hypothetical protein [Alphaproteobacteria bacterium]